MPMSKTMTETLIELANETKPAAATRKGER